MSDAHDALGDDPVIGPLIAEYGILELEPANDLFERLVISIVNQVISTEAARTVRGQLFDAVEVTPEGILAADREDLRAVGLSPQKVRAMKSVATWFDTENVTRERFRERDDEDILTELTDITGVGDWTAKMFLLLALGREDVFPVEDLAVRRAVEELIGDLTRPEMRERAAAWAPHRSIATLYLWQHYVDENADIEDVIS